VEDLKLFSKGLLLLIIPFAFIYFASNLSTFLNKKYFSEKNTFAHTNSKNNFFTNFDFGELSSFEVIPDFLLAQSLGATSTTTESLHLSAATTLPNPKIMGADKLIASANNTSNQQGISNVINSTNPIETIDSKKAQIENPVIIVGNQFLVEDIDLNRFDIVSGKIRKNQYIGQILNKHNVDHSQILKISKKSKKIHDVRDINYGKKYMVLTDKYDGDKVADMFLYEPNNYDYVVYDLRNDTEVRKVKRTVSKKITQATGEIKYSLYQTMMDNNLSIELAHKLADVYAWTLDFHRLNSGDKFKVVFEEEYIGDKVVGVGEIVTAWFEHGNIPYYSFQFEQNNLLDYYDEAGNSLRKQFLKAPLRYNRISSRFTRKRYHPVLKRNKAHLGTDYAAPEGTPIRAVGDGKIVEARYAKYNGRYVKIRHNGIYSTQYLHMSKIESGIKIGTEVKQGDIIGYVGQTGLASGPHLCFRFWKNGQQVDPLKQQLPPSKPVSEEAKAAYNLVVQKWKPFIDAIGVNGEAEVAENLTNKQNAASVN